MKKRALIQRTRDNYEYGIAITPAGRRRAQQAGFDRLTVPEPPRWDKKWRLVLFDVPERKRAGRLVLTAKLRSLGFRQLQQSVWVQPFPCRELIETITLHYDLSRYVSYLETDRIDNQTHRITQFPYTLK